MPNLNAVLKSEITRLSNKAVRQQVDPIRSAASAQRKQLLDLKKQVQQLQRELAELRRASTVQRPVAESEDGAKHRFSAKGFKSLRSRLNLSAQDFGLLLKVGAQTIYNWEGEKTTPRQGQIPLIAELRKLGKREIQQRLDAIKTT